MFKKFFIFIGVATLLISCAESPDAYSVNPENDSDATAGIIGGVEAEARSPLTNRVLSVIVHEPAPAVWSNGAYVVNYTEYQCSAVALSKRVLLTAGHCWKKAPGSSHFVRVPDASGKLTEIKVSGKKIHARYLMGNDEYDLALFQLEKDLPANIEMARLPQYKGQIRPQYVNAAGFGKSVGMASSQKGVGTLRIVTLPVIDYNDRSVSFDVDQTRGKGVCQGDSGGPAYAQFQGKPYVVGVTSRTQGQETGDNIHRDLCDEYGIFIRVDNNLEWIRKYLAILNTGKKLDSNVLEHALN